MAQISRTTNPTGLVNVDRRHFIVRTRGQGADKKFIVDRLDYEAAKLPSDALVGCVAHSGNAEEYFRLGNVRCLDNSWHSIPGLENGRPLRFRFLFTKDEAKKLIGYADGVRAINESGDLGPSLIDIEPSSLNGVPWRLELPEPNAPAGEKPNILVEREIFPSAPSAARCTWFAAFVMPEVMRRVASAIALSPDALDDENNWIHSWKPFLESMNVPPPSTDPDWEDGERNTWADEVADRFARSSSMKQQIASVVSELAGGESQ